MTNPKALESALRYIATRERFEQEIRHHLEDKGFPGEAESVIAHLRHRRIIDEPRLIQSIVEANKGKKTLGRERMKALLIKRGAPENLVKDALSQPGAQSNEMIDELLQNKLKPGDLRARAGRFLVSRGFEEEEIEAALDRYFGSD